MISKNFWLPILANPPLAPGLPGRTLARLARWIMMIMAGSRKGFNSRIFFEWTDRWIFSDKFFRMKLHKKTTKITFQFSIKFRFGQKFVNFWTNLRISCSQWFFQHRLCSWVLRFVTVQPRSDAVANGESFKGRSSQSGKDFGHIRHNTIFGFGGYNKFRIYVEKNGVISKTLLGIEDEFSGFGLDEVMPLSIVFLFLKCS